MEIEEIFDELMETYKLGEPTILSKSLLPVQLVKLRYEYIIRICHPTGISEDKGIFHSEIKALYNMLNKLHQSTPAIDLFLQLNLFHFISEYGLWQLLKNVEHRLFLKMLNID